MNRDLAEKLRFVRRYTGDKFSAAKGYDLRGEMTRKRVKTIERYYEAIVNLRSKDHVVYKPKRGEKREAFLYAGQEHLPRLDRAFIHKPDPDSKLKFIIDKTRPKGSRFVVKNMRSGEMSWHVPASAFNSINAHDDRELARLYAEMLEEYADGSEAMLINANESYMWGFQGNLIATAQKIVALRRQYDSNMFANSSDSNFRNWFNGVTFFSREEQVLRVRLERATRRQEFLKEHPYIPRQRARKMRDGSYIIYDEGEVEGYVSAPAMRAEAKKIAKEMLAGTYGKRKRKQKRGPKKDTRGSK